MRINTDWSNRHKRVGIRQPDLVSDRLCKITFTIDQNQHQINIYSHSDIKSLARQFCLKMDVNFIDQIKSLIVNRIKQLYKAEKKDFEWKNKVKVVLDRAFEQEQLSRQSSYSTIVQEQKQQSLISNREDEKTHQAISHKTKYFLSNGQKKNIQTPTEKNNDQNKYDQQIQTKLNLYGKAMLMKEIKEKKIRQSNKQRKIKQMQHCTFHPQISTTNLSYSPLRVFQKLYKQGMESKKKKKIRIETLQSQQQEKQSSLPFKPQINQCSRQIVRMRNLSIESIQDDNELDKYQYYRMNSKSHLKRIQTQANLDKSKFETFTFYPQLMNNESRKNITKLSKFEQKQNHKQKGKNESKENSKTIKSIKIINSKSRNNLIVKEKNIPINQDESKTFRTPFHSNCNNQRLMNQQTCKKALLIQPIEKIQLKKQRFIENQGQFQKENDDPENLNKCIKYQCKQQRPFFEKQNNVEKESVKERALYHKRKKLIFEQIYKFLTLKQPIRAADFTKYNMYQQNFQQVTAQLLKTHKYVPDFISKIFQPMAIELEQLQISLTKDQFIWSMQKIYQSLSTPDKGVFIGWGLKLLPESIQ